MLSKVVIALALCAVAQAGQEAPPPKSVTYNVPSVSKVTYPGPNVAKSVETYSAPSIEKTTTITRTITAPLNAPAVRHVSYSAPSPPVLPAAAPVAFAAPVGVGGGYGGYAAPAVAYGGYAAGPAPAALSPYAGQAYGGLGLQTTYSAPSLGYSLGTPAMMYAAAPPLAYGPPPAFAAAAVEAAPAPGDKYGPPPPAAPVVKKGGY